MSAPQESYDAIVVGSGFGGAINARRLAEKGRGVLVLERGRRYHPGEFPRDVRNVDQLLWGFPRRKRAIGLYDLNFFSGLAVVAASGVGGGSLVYANVHIRPDAIVFDDPRWPAGFNRDSLDPYYDRVAEAIGLTPVPGDIPLPKRAAFRQAAAILGREVFDPDEAVDWKACKLVTECEFGCQVGAKKSLDHTYLKRAEAAGAQIREHAWVTHVEPCPTGYRVHCRDVVTDESTFVEAARVVLGAGTLGTNGILLRSRDVARTLPKVSTLLGHGFSANGDFQGSIQNARDQLSPWHGPDVTSVMMFFDQSPSFTMAAPSFSRPVMEVLASLGQPSMGWLRPLAPLLWPRLEGIATWLAASGMLSKPLRFPAAGAGDPGRMTNLFAIGRDNGGGRIVWKNDRLDILWDYRSENAALIARMEEAMREVSAAYGGRFAPLATWELCRRILTVHPLGGCHLSASPETGVVSERGEVHNYPGLFVADGSVIPAALGFHPSMTISAVAELIAESAA